MKTNLITLHSVTNFGSLLQTYATQYVLEDAGCDLTVLDFVPSGLSLKEAVWPSNRSFVTKLIKILPALAVNVYQILMARSFLKKYIKLSSEQYHNYEELLRGHPKADVYVSGSDQVWNTQNNNQPNDLMAYYLCFAPDRARKIAYASSFGKTEFEDTEKVKITPWLKRYDSLSVREDTALETLNELGIDDGVHVCDPTLLLSAEAWRHFCTRKAPGYRYVFVYNLNRNKLVESISRLIAAKEGIKIINFADTLQFEVGAKNKLFNTPMDFINMIANADYVVTDSFHGTAFSINFEKQFISVPAPKYNSRLESILRRMNLMRRMVSSAEDAVKELNNPIDYNDVCERLNAFRAESMDFLKDALHE